MKTTTVRSLGSLAVYAACLLATGTAYALNPAGEGRRIFLSENCYGCHGGRGGGGMGPNIRDEAEDLTQADVNAAVQQGLEGGMPAFPGITTRQLVNIKAYFDSMRHRGEPTFTHWWEPNPSQ